MTLLAEAAVRYAQRGWPVFPLVAFAKRPLTPNGLLDASDDLERVAQWWTVYPQANIGVRTGCESGLVVLDADGDDGAESLRDLEREHGPLPRTASVKTPRGQHYYFRHSGPEIRNSAGRLGLGLDVRGDGGYVVAPPSRVDGRAYEPDERAPISPMPSWLLERLAEPDRERQAAPASEWLRVVQGVGEGERNAAVARLAGHLMRRYVDVDLVAELVHLVNESRFRPPLDRDEVERVIDSIAGREARRRQRAAA